MYGLKENTVKNIKDIFSQFEKIEKAILYGSRAKGNYRNGSDIDITLFGDGLKLNIVYKLQDKLDELNLPYIFDISIFKQIDNKNLIKHINRVGKVFYSIEK
ncbi:MAG: nucleotidyltransferase domain-containing protein [Candidatus Marinimicrobia bacterium]|nr:nucleotidyltransferase domain-containing protein [Candidatus Neomarinimicrobiota bacterium]